MLCRCLPLDLPPRDLLVTVQRVSGDGDSGAQGSRQSTLNRLIVGPRKRTTACSRPHRPRSDFAALARSLLGLAVLAGLGVATSRSG